MAVAGRLGGLNWRELGKRAWTEFRADRIPDQSAMLAFYFLLSIFPLLLLLIGLLGVLYQSDPGLQDDLFKYLGRVAPSSASSLIHRTVIEAVHNSGPLKLSLQLLFTWLPASQGVMAVMDGLNIAYGVRERRPWWKRHLAAYGLTFVSLLLLASGLMFLIFGGHASEALGSRFGFSMFIASLWEVLNWLLFIGFALLAFNILYIYGPTVEHRRWRWLMPGTIVGVALWLAVSFGFKVYLHFLDFYANTYGSIGAVIILMLWFYFFGIAILAGAEVNSEIEKAGREEPQTRT